MTDLSTTEPTAMEVPSEDADSREVRKGIAVEHYAAAMAASLNVKLELDKSLLTLSSAGIAAFVALLTTAGPGTKFVAVCSCIALLCFAVVICVVLVSFNLSGRYLNQRMNGDDPSRRWLARLDWIAAIIFIVSIAASLAAGASIGINFLWHKEAKVENKDINDLIADIQSGEVTVVKSLTLTGGNPLAAYLKPAVVAIAPVQAAQDAMAQVSSSPVVASAPVAPAVQQKSGAKD